MKCKKCGAEIPKGKLYCSVCGAEVQLVPDYNFFEDDMLSDIIQNGAGKNITSSKHNSASQTTDPVSSKKKSPAKKKKVYIISGICLVLVIAVLTAFFVYQDIQKKHQNSYSYQYEQGIKYQSAKDYDAAIVSFQNALRLRPDDTDTEDRLLEIYEKTKDDDAMISLLQKRLKRDPTDTSSCKKLIEIYDTNKEYDKILSLCEEVKGSSMLDLFSDYLVDQPKFSNISGTYEHPLTISITSEKDYDIFYTDNGTDPVEYGKRYHDPISLKEEGTTILKAVTKNEKGIYSEPVTANYTIRYEPPAMPKVTPASGTYTEPQTITISVPSDCKAYYTWDGSDPTENSSLYTGALEMPAGNQVLSVILVNSAGLKSNIYRVNYVYMP